MLFHFSYLCITLNEEYISNQDYSTISILGLHHPTSNPFYLFNINFIILFRFIISSLFLNIIVLFLFGCFRFLRHDEFWVQFIFVRWLLQYIILVSILIGIWLPYLIGNNLNCYWGVLLLRNRRINCERYFTILVLGFQHETTHEPVNKTRHYVLDNSLTLLVVNLVLDQWFNQTLYVSYFTVLV